MKLITRIQSLLSPVYRLPLARVYGLASIILFIISAYCFQYSTSIDLINEAFLTLLLGAFTLAICLFIHPLFGRRVTAQPASYTLTPGHPNYLVSLVGIVCMAALLEINGNFLRLAFLHGTSIHAQFALLVAGVLLTTWGIGGWRPRLPRFPHCRKQSTAQEPPIDSESTQPHLAVSLLSTQSSALSTYLLLSLILLLAFAARLWHVGTAVHHFVDEVHFTGAIMSLRAGGAGLDILAPFSGITAFPWLFPYLQAGGVGVLGRNLEGLRIVSVFAGTLGVAAVYLLGRTLFDRRTALLAALLLAVFPPHIQFSRLGLNNIIDPQLGTLAVAFLLRGLKTNRRLDFALAGGALGLTQYFYEGGRLLYPALMLLILTWYGVFKPRFTLAPRIPRANVATLKTRLRGLLVMAFVALLIGIPIYTTLISRGEPLDTRFQTVGVGGSYWMRVVSVGRPQTLEQHIVMPFLVYVRLPEIALYYGGEQGMMLAYVVPFALLGALTLLYRPRSLGFLLVIWILLTSAGNMLMTEAAVYARYVVAFPALALIIAVGVRTAGALIWPRHSRLKNLALIVVVAMLVVGQLTYYFGPHLERYNQQLRQSYDSEDAMFRAAAFPWGTQVHVLAADNPGLYYLIGILSYLSDGLNVYVLPPQDLTPAYLAGLQRGVNQAFFVEQYDTATVDLLRQYYELTGPFTSPYNVQPDRQLLLYYAHYGGAPLG